MIEEFNISAENNQKTIEREQKSKANSRNPTTAYLNRYECEKKTSEKFLKMHDSLEFENYEKRRGK